jgi:hypothetical protein
MPNTPINPRKALAGIYLAKGVSQKKSLELAGYAKGTARAPHEGLRAAQCLQEARKLDGTGVVSRLPLLIRGKLETAIEDTPADSAHLLRLVRAADHIERYHGVGKGQAEDSSGNAARTVVERLTLIQNLTVVAREKGILPAEAEIVEPIGESDPGANRPADSGNMSFRPERNTGEVIISDADLTVDTKEVSESTSDNSQYVNLDSPLDF